MSEDSLQKLKPPLWASRLRRFLRRTGPLAFLGAIVFFVIGIGTSNSPVSRGLAAISALLFYLGLLYALFGLLLRMLLPSFLQFSLGGLLATILTAGACVSAMMSTSAAIQLGGQIGLGVGFVVAAYFCWRNDALYDWSEQ